VTGLPTLDPEISDLGLALGLLTDGSGGPELDSDWFANPGEHLSGALGDADRRAALVRFVDTVLGEGEHTEAGGVTYLHLFDLRQLAGDSTLPDLTVQVSLDDRPAAYVEVGLAAKLQTDAPATSTTVVVPLYRAAKDGQPVPQPFALLAGSAVSLSTELTLSTDPPATDEFGLAGVSASVSTGAIGGSTPSFTLVLKGLHLPGATTSSDLTIGGPGADIEQTLLSLVLGLVRQAADSLAGPAAADVEAALSLLGLGTTVGIPALPVEDLLAHGTSALQDWFVEVMGTTGAQTAWVGALADLLGGTTGTNSVTIPIGTGAVSAQITFNAATAPSGHLVVTPSLGLVLAPTVAAGAVQIGAEAKVDLVTIDTATGALSALPNVEIVATATGTGGGPGGKLLHTDALNVGSARLGLAVRTGVAQAVVQAVDVDLEGQHHDVVDLSTPDAVVAAAGQVAATLLGNLLDALGAAGEDLKGLLGLIPTGGMPALDGSHLLANPLGALADWWHDLLTNHAADVPAVLARMRDLIAAELQSAVPITVADPNIGPWTIPITSGFGLDIALVDGRVVIEPTVSFRISDLAGGCTVVLTSLRVRLASFDLAALHAEFPLAVTFALAARGRGSTQARLALGPVAIVADSVGVQATWSPSSPLSFGLQAPGLGVDAGAGVIPLVLPTVDSSGHVSVPPDAWGSVEMLVGVLAASANTGWLTDVVELVGWQLSGRPRGPKLSLADLVANPATALRTWLGALAGSSDLLTTLLNTLARVTGGSADGLAGVFSGSGTPEDPWLASLGGSAVLPAIAVWMGPNGPVMAPALAGPALTGWRPGQPGLGPDGLAQALFDEAGAGVDVADLAAGRQGIAAGLTALAGRWVGTDGRVAPPTPPVTGLTVRTRTERDWTQLAAVDPADVITDPLPPVVVRVAVGPVADLPWTPAAGRLLDLTQPGVVPGSFSVPNPATGDWVVALASRTDATLGADDPSGLIGQAARLTQVLTQLSGAGQIALVAFGGAGHAARLSADTVSGVTHLVTLGSPWSAATFDTARNGVPADGLRLLKALLPAVDEADPDDPDLAHGRALVTGFFDAVRGKPAATEIEATRPDTPIRAGLAAIGVFGVLSEAAVARAMTAVFAAGLAQRAQGRAPAAAAPPAATCLGLRLPFSFLTPPGGHGVTLSGSVLLTLGSIATADAAVTVAPQLGIDFALADTDAWLIGGPGTTPVGGAPALELRRVSGRVTVGLAGGPSSAVVTLGEGAALGADWDRLVVDPPTAATGTLDAQPLLPEAQALLSALTTKLAAVAAGSPAAIFATLLHAVGITQADGALVPDSAAHLLHDPGAQLRAITAAVPSRAELLTALAGLIPGLAVAGDAVSLTVGPLAVDADMGARTIGITASGSEGILPWQVGTAVDAAGHVSVSAGLGDQAHDPFALSIQSGPMRAQLVRPGNLAPIAVFPTPDIDGLVGLAAVAVPAEATRVLLEALRDVDTGVATALDTIADVVGPLGPPDSHGVRPYIAPVQLFTDPVGWFKDGVLSATNGGSFDTTKVVDLLEAVKPFIGLDGTPRGVWPITDGVQVTVTAGATGPTLALAVDATTWLTAPATFAAGFSLGLTLPGNAAPHPTVEVFVGVPDGPSATTTPQHRRAAHLIVDGNQVRVLLRPSTGADIEVYPSTAGLGALLEAGIEQVLPTVLTQLAAMTGDAVRTEVADLVGSIGRGLAVATGTPAVFDGNALKALAADPGAYLRAQLGNLLTAAGAALDPFLIRLLSLGAGQHAAVLSSSGVLTVTVRTVVLEVHPSPLSITVGGSVTGLPVVNAVTMSLGVDGAGLSAWSAQVGPAAIDLGRPVLRPFARVDYTGATGWQADIGLGLDALGPVDVGHQELTARWRQTGGLAVLVTTNSSATNVTEDSTAAGVAVAAIDAVLALVGGWVLGVSEVKALLDQSLGSGGKKVRFVLEGSILVPSVDPPQLLPNVLDGWPDKLLTMAGQLAACAPKVAVGPVELGIANDGGILGVSLNLTNPVPLSSGDTTLTLEVDASWIDPPPTPGIVVEILQVSGPTFVPRPGIKVDGIGLRLGKSGGRLIDEGLRLDSVAVHLFGSVIMGSNSLPELGGGVELELGGLAVPLGSGGGDNAVAKGIMSDAGGSGSPPRPAFSPAFAVQSHGTGVEVSLRAGSGDGPWYLPIQRAFGPVYLEQIGLGVAYQQNLTPRQLEMISLYLSGQVSLLGLTAAVDNLRFGYHVSQPMFSPSSWEVDVDGFAIAADFGPLTLAGGLAKFPLSAPLTGVEYLGMLKIGYAAYGIDLFGGYAHPTTPSGTEFASFFAFGVLHAPIGGPPAFFITGIGIGFGINRELITPTIDQVNTNPFMVALRASGPTPEPMQQLQDLRAQVPAQLGDYWIAAGISFTSFVLITGEILVTVQFGDGLEIAVLGLARAQLPTADLTLVSVELALLARFSEKDGLLLVQAQLTSNSWLLDKSVRLTGGFAFETWWKGPNAGQFVITVGGYHPRFHHDGYPQVPRVGLSWQPADEISITGGVYFALCSEAIMAGAGIHAAAHLGPAHASLDLGGDGIVFFDPFYFDVSVYAEASVGITIDLLFGSIDIDVSLGFDVEIEGPPFYLHGHFSVCGVGIPFEIGSRADPADLALTADAFAAKYLRGNSDAQIVQASVILGGLTAGKSDAPNSGGVAKPPDGSAANPFRVVPEFQITFVTTAPAENLALTSAAGTHNLSVSAPGLGVAPMYSATLDTTLTITVTSDTGQPFRLDAVRLTARAAAAFPKGVWGPAQNPQAKTVPTGDTVDACDGMTADTTLPDSVFTGAAPIDYHQIELPLTGRKPLPFITNRTLTDARVTAAKALKDAAKVLTAGNPDGDTRFLRAALVMSAAGTGLTTVSSLRGDRSAAPSFGSLADDLVDSPDAVSTAVEPVVVDRTPPAPPRFPPLVKSVLGIPLALTLDRPGGTTVKDPGTAVTQLTPTLAAVRAATAGMSQAALQVVPRTAQATGGTVAAAGTAPLTRLASSPVGTVANAQPVPLARARLADMTAAMVGTSAPKGTGTGRRRPRRKGFGDGAIIHEGELAVITIANRPSGSVPDTVVVTGGLTRVLCMAAGGRVLDDSIVGADGAPGSVSVPLATERIVVVAQGASAAASGVVAGWYSGQSLPSIGWSAALGGGVVVTSQGNRVPANRERGDGGWVAGTELSAAGLTVTNFTDPVTAIAIAIDDQVGGDAAASVSMRLQDATRMLDAAGEAVPPQVLVDGVRSLLVYAVETTGPNPRVFVHGGSGGQLAGVLGSATGVADLAGTVSEFGMAAAVAQPLVGGPGLRQVSIKLGDDAPPPPKPPPTPKPPLPKPPVPKPPVLQPPVKKPPVTKPPAKAPVQKLAKKAKGAGR
jgi:large repetitive protein